MWIRSPLLKFVRVNVDFTEKLEEKCMIGYTMGKINRVGCE